MIDCTVVIVSYNTRDLLRRCLHSLFEHSTPAAVWVVDNVSSDGSADMVAAEFPQVHLVRSETNLGFAGGNNLAIRHAITPYVCLLNPDTELRNDAIALLCDHLRANPEVGACGPNLTNPDGSHQDSAFGFPGLAQAVIDLFEFRGRHRLVNTRINGRYPTGKTQPFEIDAMLGACMALRRTAIDQVGMLDDSFFMYCEEIDWCWRLKRSGWRLVSVPAATVMHVGGASTSQFRETMFVELYRSRLALYDRYHGPLTRWLYRHILRAGLPRMANAATPSESDLKHRAAEAVLALL